MGVFERVKSSTSIRYYGNTQYTRTYFNTIFFTHVSRRAMLSSCYVLYFGGKDRKRLLLVSGNLHKRTPNVYSRSFPLCYEICHPQ